MATYHQPLWDSTRPRNPEISLAALTCLADPSAAVRTEPVVAILEELHMILSDSLRPDDEKLVALRRAVRLLQAFLTSTQLNSRT